MVSNMIDVGGILKNAVRFHRAGLLKRAQEGYRRILEFMPDHAEALHLMGLVHAEQGDATKAKEMIRRAIEKDETAAVFHVSYGDILRREGEVAGALDCYRKALSLQPDLVEALCNMGNALRELGRSVQAIACYRKALGINPRLPQLFNNLGLACHQQKHYGAAEAAFKKAISLDSAYADAYSNLGNVYRDRSEFEAAVDQYRRALTLAPENTSINYNLAVLYHSQQVTDKAMFYYRKAVEYQPPIADAYNNLGIFCQDQNRPDQAIAYYDQAIQIDPGHFDAHFNRALALLATGRFEEGWKTFEWRFKRDAWRRIYPHRLQGRRWDGSKFSGQTLFIHSEQGFGDTIWLARYLPQVKSLGGRVIFEARSELIDLLQQVDGVDQLTTMSFEHSTDFAYDYYVPLMSLPALLGTTMETIPANIPYLYAPNNKREYWATQIKGSGLKVGLVWAAKSTNEQNRSCPAECLSSLCNIDGVRIFGLQKGDDAFQVNPLPAEVTHLGPEFKSFADTAAAIECLDLVISVDTAVAHLAGAMGKPVWVLLPYAADWKWLMDRPDSPWYPTMRLFRQPKPGDWEPIVRRIEAQLRTCISPH